MQPATSIQQSRATDSAAVRRFLRGESGAGPMFDEFCHSGLLDEEDVVASGVAGAQIFEFEWGFVAELAGRGCSRSWNLYVRHVWRTGTREWWAPFEASHQRLVQHELAQERSREDCRCEGLQFANGKQSFAAGSYVSDCESAACARLWMGRALLPRLWPAVIKATFDPIYKSNAFSRLG